MRAAALQFDVWRGDVARNLARVEDGLAEARDRGCALVVLPEMWTTSFADFATGARTRELLGESERALARVSELSRELGLVVAGSAPAANGEALPFNRLTVFARGERVLEYDKVHLFSPTAEDASFSAGGTPPGTSEAARNGLATLSGAVCYDLRFAEAFRPSFRAGAEILVVPAQWPTTRAMHWRALAIGRAALSQAFVVACNRIGRERVGRRELELEFPGNSLVVDPHGRVLAEGAGRDGLVVAELDLDAVRRLRRRVPVAKDRRDDLYVRW